MVDCVGNVKNFSKYLIKMAGTVGRLQLRKLAQNQMFSGSLAAFARPLGGAILSASEPYQQARWGSTAHLIKVKKIIKLF